MRNLREYHKPDTLDDALRLLTRDDVRAVPLAGGTELVATTPPDVDAVVDLGELPLTEITQDVDGLRLGGLVRLSALAESPEVQAFADGVVADVARATATSLLRNQATLAGSLLTRLPRSEFVPVLLVLDADVTLQRAEGPEAMPLVMLYDNLYEHTRQAVITEVRLPTLPDGARIRRHRVARSPADQPILSVTALTRVADGTFAEVRIAAAGIGPHPRRLTAVEDELLGVATTAEDVTSAVEPLVDQLALPDDSLASAEYRRSTLPVLVRRAVLGT